MSHWKRLQRGKPRAKMPGRPISSINVHWQGGREGNARFPSSVAGLGTGLGSPAELPQINMRSGSRGDRFASQQDFKAGEKTGRIEEGGGGGGGTHTPWARSDGKRPNPSPETDTSFFMRCKPFQVASAVSGPRPSSELLGFKLGALGLKRPQVKASSFKPSQPRWKQEGLILLGVNPASGLLFFPQSA